MKPRVRTARHLLPVLLICAGCADMVYQQWNDPSRDAWQKPKDVIHALNITPGRQVADLGAGGGYFTFPLAEAVGPAGKVYAVDVDETSLRFIEREAKQRGVLNIEFVLATSKDARLPQTVDLVFTCNTYHHLPERVAYFKALVRTLTPDGRIAIIEYKKEGIFHTLFGHSTARETVRQEMETAGYHLVHDYDFLPKQHFQIFSLIQS